MAASTLDAIFRALATRPRWLAWLLALAVFLAVAPTLSAPQFTSGSENLLAATVVEMRAGGAWLLPRLNGEPRIRKPPLPTWIAAAGVPQSVIDGMSDRNAADRTRALERFAFYLRWPALFISCLIVVATFELGKTVADDRVGLLSAAVCASSLLLLRFCRAITPDIHLALWVVLTNLCLAKAFTGKSPMRWLPAAGLCLGVGFMCKGPVALAQTVLPAALLLRPARLFDRGRIVPFVAYLFRRNAMPFGCAAAIFLAVAAPWYAWVFVSTPGVAGVWRAEITRDGATGLAADPFYVYFGIVLLMAPWIGFFVAGVIDAATRWKRDRMRRLALSLAVVPIVILSLVRDKNVRYLLPMIAPASLLAGWALAAQFKSRDQRRLTDSALAITHVVLLMFIAVGLPAAGVYLPSADGSERWWSAQFAFAAAPPLVLLAAIVGAAGWRRPSIGVAVTVVFMLAAQTVFMFGYTRADGGVSEMKPIADAIWANQPAAAVWFVDLRAKPKPLPQDLQIYLNRPVRAVTSAEAIPAPSADRVLLVLQRAGEPAPPAVAGWREFAVSRTPERSWHALAAE